MMMMMMPKSRAGLKGSEREKETIKWVPDLVGRNVLVIQKYSELEI